MPPLYPKLERVASCDELVRAPIGKLVSGQNFLIWCTKPELCGLVLWGRLSAVELELLTCVYDRGEGNGIATPCDFVFDARRLDGVEPGAYETLVRDTATRIGGLERRLRRQALLRGSGIVGAAVSGFYPALEVTFASRIFTELAPALAWLGETDDRLSDHLERLIPEVVSGSSLVDRLRVSLAKQTAHRTSIEQAAHLLAVSPRSLQRHLRDAGTSFRAELDRARRVIAETLLRETDLKIATIAERVGSSTEANFIAFFRRIAGVSPAEWRRQNVIK